MSERLTGYSLLGVGIIIMIFATFQIISVFTGKAKPIPLFQQEQTQNETTQNSGFNPADILKQIQGNGEGFNAMPQVQIVDPEILNNILNLTVYYFIMQFLLGLGFKLSSLGVQLVRPIHVHLKNKEPSTEQSNSN